MDVSMDGVDGILSLLQMNGNGENIGTTEQYTETLNQVLAMTVAQLFDAGRLNTLQGEHRLSYYLRALVIAFAPSSNDKKSSMVITGAFNKAVNLILLGNLYPEEQQQISDCLLSNAYTIGDEDCLKLLFKMFGKDWDFNNPEKLAALSVLLELGLRLAQRSNAEVRVQLHEFVMGFNGGSWPGCAAVMLASAAVDASESQVECELVLQRIRDCLQVSVIRNAGTIEPEELPTLLYHAVALGRKQGGSSAYLKSVVVDILTTSVDSILEQSGLSDVFEESQGAGSSSNSSSQFTATAQNASRFRVAPVLATIVHHLSLLLAKDQGVASEVLGRVRCGNFFHGGSDLSLSTLMLCLLAALVPRQESTALNVLAEALTTPFTVASRFSAVNASRSGSGVGHWLPFSCGAIANQATPQQLCRAIERLVRSPLMTETLVPPLLRLAILLLDVPAVPSHYHTFSLLGHKLQVRSHPYLNDPFDASGSQGDVRSPAGLGALIVTNLFFACDYARSNIIHELVIRLLMGASSGAASSSAADGAMVPQQVSASASGIAVSIFACLAQRCPHGMLGVQGDLYEAFSCLGDLPRALAAGMVVALSPLFPNCAQLVDRCTMSVRKASFSRDAHCRQAAVAALIALMREQLLVLRRSAGTSSSRVPALRFGAEATMGISIEEGLALLRRFLQQQTAVQTVVYARVYLLQKEFPVMRSLVLQLLASHFRSLICPVADEVHMVNQAHGYAKLADECTERLDLNACVNNNNNHHDNNDNNQPTQRLKGLFCTLITIAKTVLENANTSGGSLGGNAHEHTNRSYVAGENSAIDVDVQEAVDVCQRIWSIAISCANLDATDFLLEVGDADDEANDSTIKNIIRRRICFLDALQACAVVVYALPANLGSGSSLASKNRMQLCAKLTQRAKVMRFELRNLQRAAQKATHKHSKAATATASRNSRAQPREIEEPPMLHSLHMDIRFAVEVLGSLYVLSKDAHGMDEEEHMEPLREETRVLVTRAALEAAVCAFDSLDSMVISARASNVANELDCRKCITETLDIPDPGALRAILEDLPPLALSLLKFLSVLGENEPSEKVAKNLVGAGMLPHLDQAQLVLRCILSLSRFGLDVTAMLVSPTDASSINVKERAMRSLDALLGSALKLFREQLSAEQLASKGIELTASFTGAAYTAPSNTTKTFADMRASYNHILKVFLKGVLKGTPSPGTCERQALTAASERLCAVLCCIAELIAPASFEQRNDICTKSVRTCVEHLELPTPALATTLIELIILATPETPQQRYEAALKVATGIEDCANQCKEFFDEEGFDFMDEADQNSKDDADRQTRVGYLSLSTLPHAVSCLVAILERGAADVGMMLRLRDQRFSAVVQRRTLRKPVAASAGPAEPAASATSSAAAADLSEKGSLEVFARQRYQLDTAIHDALRGLMLATKPLLTQYAGSASEKVLALLTKLFKIQARIEKDFPGGAEQLPASFRRLLNASSVVVKPAGILITELQNQTVSDKKKKKKSAKSKSVVVPRQAKIVPELVYQLEQAEVQLVRLSTRNKGNTDFDLASYLKPTEIRGFKINVDENLEPNAKKRAREA